MGFGFGFGSVLRTGELDRGRLSKARLKRVSGRHAGKARLKRVCHSPGSARPGFEP